MGLLGCSQINSEALLGENVNYFYNVVVGKVGKAFLSQT